MIVSIILLVHLHHDWRYDTHILITYHCYNLMLWILNVLFNLECTPVRCRIFCEHGFKVVDGCEVCECKPNPCLVSWFCWFIMGLYETFLFDTGVFEVWWTTTTNSLLIQEMIVGVSLTTLCQELVNTC